VGVIPSAREPSRSSHRSTWITLGCVLAAFASAVIAARGPAHRERAHVSWPESSAAAPAPVAQPDELAYTPLLLSSHSAESLVVDIPCALGTSPTARTVFATVRRPAEVPGLAITMRDATLEITIGTSVLAAVPWPDASGCRGRLSVDDFGWQLTRDDQVLATGVSVTPVISGFYTAIEPTGDKAVRAELTTRPFGSRPSSRQWVLYACALALGALAIVRLSRRRTPARRPIRPRYGTEDVVVLGALAVWWLIGPWFFDDGWLMATVRSRRSSGSFNNYFDTLATQLPLGFAHHMLLSPFARFDAPFLIWRLVPLAACVGTWLLLRTAYAMLLGDQPPRRGSVALAAAYVVFAFGWLMALRPEPVVALLSAVAGVACLSYAREWARPQLIVAIVAAAIAATLHPSGIVAAAPLAVASPTMLRDARRGLVHAAEVAAVMALGATVGVGLLFADTDIALWRRNASIFRGDGFHSRGINDEALRYRDLLTNGTVPAVASVLFGALALVLFVVRLAARRGRLQRSDAAGFALLFAAALLTITPSKWIYHFGSAAAIATFAIAIETARTLEQPERAAHFYRRLRRWQGAAIVIAVGLIVGRALASRADAQYFMKLDAPRLPHVVTRSVLLALAVAVVAAAHFARDRQRANRLAGQWAIPAGLVVVAATSALLLAVVPSAIGPRWAMGRTGIPDLFGGGCSLADRIDVSDPATRQMVRSVAASVSELPTDDARSIHPPLPELADVPVFATDRNGAGVTGTLTTPWFAVATADDARDIVVAVKAGVEDDGNELVAEWGRGDAGNVLARTPVHIDRTPPRLRGVLWMGWRLVRLSRLAAVPDEADLVRLVAHDRDTALGGVAFSAPFIVSHARLSTYLDAGTVLVSPPQLPVFTCVSPPALDDGLAAMPDFAIGFEYNASVREIGEIGSNAGPWYLAADAYYVERVWAWLTDTEAVMLLRRNDDAPLGREIAATIRHLGN
jgi:arabinosyltransferase B/arabinosyltransferase C